MGLAKKIPIIGPLFSFNLSVLGESLRELTILWFFSSLPLIFSGVSVLQKKDLHTWLAELLSVKVVFAYTASFLSTIILLLIDRVVFPRKDNIFHGATIIFCISLLILLFSAYAYGNDGINLKDYSWVAYSMYVLSLYFWLLAIADTKQVGVNYNERSNNEEADFAKLASRRRMRGNA